MSNQDTRNLSPSELSVLRQRAVSAVLKGEKQCHVAKLFGVSAQSLSGWMKDYRKRGEASWVYEKRGRKVGGGALTVAQGSVIVNLIISKTPDQLGLPFFLWTRAAVVELIAQKLGVRLTEQCAGQYLEKWDMTPQKPARRAWQQDPAAVQEWLKKRFPRIKAAAKRRGAMVLWLDEMGIRSDDQVGRTYGRRGRTPVVPVSGQRFGCNMISALSNRGSLYLLGILNLCCSTLSEHLTTGSHRCCRRRPSEHQYLRSEGRSPDPEATRSSLPIFCVLPAGVCNDLRGFASRSRRKSSVELNAGAAKLLTVLLVSSLFYGSVQDVL